MFDLISKLSNVERLSGFVKPYTDRINKLNELAAAMDVVLTVITDGNNNNLAVPEDDWLEFKKPIRDMIHSSGGTVLFVDPATNYTSAIQFIETGNPDYPLEGYSAYSDGDGGYTNRQNPFFFAEKSIDIETGNVYYDVNFLPQFLKDSRSDDGAEQVDVIEYLSRIQDQLNCYNVSLDTIKMTIKNKLLNAADLIAKIKTNYVGLKNGALEVSQQLVNALTTHDIASIVNVFDKYINPQGIEVNDDGSVSFPETTATQDVNFGAVIGQSLPTIITTFGTVIAAISKPIGVAIAGFGYIASAATNALNTVANDSTRAIISDNSENVDIGIKVRQEVYTDSAADLLNRNCIENIISDSGFQPHKYELPGISGYVWPANYDGTAYSASHCKMVHEAYLSCRGYIKQEDLVYLISDFFNISRVSYTYSAGFGRATVRLTPTQDSLEMFLSAVYKNITPLDFDGLKFESEEYINLMYEKAVLTDCVVMTALYALLAKVIDGDNYVDFIVGINNHHAYPESPSTPYNVFSIGIQFLCDPYHDTFNDEPMVGWDEDHAEWNTNPNYTEAFEVYNEQQMKIISQAVDTLGIPDDFNRTILQAVKYISQHAMSLPDPSDQSIVDCSFQFYPVVQRFDFRIRPPKWTRRSLVVNAILTGAIVASIAIIAAVVTIKVNSWRKRKALQTQAQTEAAWDKLKAEPSEKNMKDYRRACLKQNTIGKVYGCAPVSNTNYWGSTNPPSSVSTSIREDIVNSVPEMDESVQILTKKVSEF